MDQFDTHPVVDKPDSVTHWSCPKNNGESHHIIGNTCKYCKVDTNTLRKTQDSILQSQKGK